MTEDLVAKLNTAGAFDSPWLKEQLRNWNVTAEQKKADFLEHCYQCSGRDQGPPGVKGLYTGLWQNFCITEAGPAMRERYFEMMDAIRQFEESKLQQVT